MEDDLSILSTMSALSIEENDAIREDDSLLNTQLRALDTQAESEPKSGLVGTPNRLRELHGDCEHLSQGACAVDQALLSPIHNLADELLGQIFIEFIPPLEFNAYNSFEPPYLAIARNTLGSVCRKWRAVAWCTPRAWTTLSFSRRLPRNLTLIKEWLTNSKTCPIDIYFQARSWYSSEHQARVLRLIHTELTRVRQLYFVTDSWDHHDFNELFPLHSEVDASRMELLWVKSIAQTGSLPGSPRINAPNLEYLGLEDYPCGLRCLEGAPVVALRHIKLTISRTDQSGSPRPPLCIFLGHCYQLEVLELDGWDEDAESHPSTSIALPQLTSLSLKGNAWGSFPKLVDHLLTSFRMPALKTLTLWLVRTDLPTQVERFLGLLADETVHSLQYVDLKGLDLPGAMSLDRMPNLSTLLLDNCILNEGLFTFITATLSSRPTRQPFSTLGKFKLDLQNCVFQGDSAGPALVNLLHRLCAREAGPSPLAFPAFISVQKCCGLDQQRNDLISIMIENPSLLLFFAEEPNSDWDYYDYECNCGC